MWYGSLDVETTVYETAWHWYQFVLDSFPDEEREIVTERRVFDVRCDALLIDLRGKEAEHPGARQPHELRVHATRRARRARAGQNGLLVHSARCEGTNGAIFRPERLSNVRDRTYLTYRLNPQGDRMRVERTPGRKWMEFAPSALG